MWPVRNNRSKYQQYSKFQLNWIWIRTKTIISPSSNTYTKHVIYEYFVCHGNNNETQKKEEKKNNFKYTQSNGIDHG